MRLDAPIDQVGGSGDITLLVTVGAGEGRIVSRLRELEGVRRVQVQPTAQSDQTTALVTFHGQPEPERRLFGLMSGLGIPILHLSRCQDSLEQVFLNVIAS